MQSSQLFKSLKNELRKRECAISNPEHEPLVAMQKFLYDPKDWRLIDYWLTKGASTELFSHDVLRQAVAQVSATKKSKQQNCAINLQKVALDDEQDEQRDTAFDVYYADPMIYLNYQLMSLLINTHEDLNAVSQAVKYQLSNVAHRFLQQAQANSDQGLLNAIYFTKATLGYIEWQIGNSFYGGIFITQAKHYFHSAECVSHITLPQILGLGLQQTRQSSESELTVKNTVTHLWQYLQHGSLTDLVEINYRLVLQPLFSAELHPYYYNELYYSLAGVLHEETDQCSLTKLRDIISYMLLHGFHLNEDYQIVFQKWDLRDKLLDLQQQLQKKIRIGHDKQHAADDCFYVKILPVLKADVIAFAIQETAVTKASQEELKEEFEQLLYRLKKIEYELRGLELTAQEQKACDHFLSNILTQLHNQVHHLRLPIIVPGLQSDYPIAATFETQVERFINNYDHKALEHLQQILWHRSLTPQAFQALRFSIEYYVKSNLLGTLPDMLMDNAQWHLVIALAAAIIHGDSHRTERSFHAASLSLKHLSANEAQPFLAYLHTLGLGVELNHSRAREYYSEYHFYQEKGWLSHNPRSQLSASQLSVFLNYSAHMLYRIQFTYHNYVRDWTHPGSQIAVYSQSITNLMTHHTLTNLVTASDSYNLLGKLYYQQGHINWSIKAFNHAAQLGDRHAQLIADYLQSDCEKLRRYFFNQMLDLSDQLSDPLSLLVGIQTTDNIKLQQKIMSPLSQLRLNHVFEKFAKMNANAYYQVNDSKPSVTPFITVIQKAAPWLQQLLWDSPLAYLQPGSGYYYALFYEENYQALAKPPSMANKAYDLLTFMHNVYYHPNIDYATIKALLTTQLNCDVNGDYLKACLELMDEYLHYLNHEFIEDEHIASELTLNSAKLNTLASNSRQALLIAMEQAFIDIFRVNAYASKTKKQLLAIMEQRLNSLIAYLQKQNQANYNGALPRLYQSYALLMIKFADQLSACGEQASSQSSLVDSASIVDKLNWAKANITQRQIGFFAHYYSYWRSNSNQTASSSAERHYLHNATLQQELESRLNAFQNQQKLENGSCSCQ